VAEQQYRSLLQDHESLVAARNNLALALAGQGRFDEAAAEIDQALADNDDPLVEAELRDTERTIGAMRDAER
jgi:Flp pilus assembly protein TadD